MEEFNRIEEFERQYHRTLVGPHLDKFEIMLGDRNLKSHSSGEKKIHLLMLYIAFIRHYRHVNSDFPVFPWDFSNRYLPFKPTSEQKEQII